MPKHTSNPKHTSIHHFNHWSTKKSWRDALVVKLSPSGSSAMKEYNCCGFNDNFGEEVCTFPNPDYDNLT